MCGSLRPQLPPNSVESEPTQLCLQLQYAHLPILQIWQVSAHASRAFTPTINVDHIARHSQYGLGVWE